MRVQLYLSFLFSIILFSSCSTDVEIGAQYEEKMVVFGLLDPNTDTQFVKINKGFFTDSEDATTFLNTGDSIFFDSTEITATISASDRGLDKGTVTLKRAQLKDLFTNAANPNHVIYYTTAGIVEDYDYELNIVNSKLGITASGNTSIVTNNLNLSAPRSNSIVNFALVNQSDLQEITWTVPDEGDLFDLKLRFYYNEYDTSIINQYAADFGSKDNFDIGILRVASSFDNAHKVGETKYIDINVFTGRTKSNSKSTLEYNFSNANFYKAIQTELPEAQNGIYRFPLYVDYIFSYAGEDLAQYINRSNAQDGLVQGSISENYSNIENAIGVFSSRTQSINRRYFYNFYSPIKLFSLVPNNDTLYDAWGNETIITNYDTLWTDDIDSVFNSQSLANDLGLEMEFSNTIDHLLENEWTKDLGFANYK